MPIITYTETNLFSVTGQDKEVWIGHGCNCKGAFGAGVAGQIADRWPECRDAYLGYLTSEDDMQYLGKVQIFVSHMNTGTTVILNMFTQYNPGPDLRMSALEQSFRKANETMKFVGVRELHIPQIGSGIAGGDWDEIAKVIDRVTPDIDVIVHVWKPKQ